MTWANDFEDRRTEGGPLGVGLATLVLGVAIGAGAAFLLAAPGSQDLRTRLQNAAGDWKSSAADALARGRERVISAVEKDYSPSSPNSSQQAGQSVRPA